MGKRHKWEKIIYKGKYSCFEIEAFCSKCGCKREKKFMGFEYTLDNKTYDNAPECNPKQNNKTTQP